MSYKKLIIILPIFAIVALVFIFWLSTNKKSQVIVPSDVSKPTKIQVNLSRESSEKPRPVSFDISPADKLKKQLTKIAASFVERYGSYSNQSNFENLEDLLPIMSTTLKNKSQRIIRQGRQAGVHSVVYYGVTTKALNSRVLNFSMDTGRAEFKISTQRQEAVGSNLNNKVYYKDIIVEMVKEDGVWKVDKIK